MGWGTPWLIALLGGGLAACSASPYQCSSDEQCIRSGAAGTCTAESFCAYPDDACDAGLRYSPNAAPELADACVDLVAGEESTSTASGSVDTSDPADCGNGQIDPGEECDDGNREGGDACTPQCLAAGRERWVYLYGGPAGADDRATALGVRSDRWLLVGGEQGQVDGTRSAMVTAVLPDGTTPIEAPWVHDDPADRRLHGLAVSGLQVTVGGDQPSEGAAGGRAWYARLSDALVTTELGAVDTLAPETARAVGFDRLVGSQDGRAWARWLDSSRPDWIGEPVDPVHAAAVRGDGVFVVVGATTSDPRHWWLVSSLTEVVAEGTAQGDSIVAAGFDGWGRPVLAGARDGAPWLEVYETDGTSAWSLAAGWPGQTGVAQAVAGTPAGDLYAVGVDAAGTQGWVARFGPDGALRWANSVREGSPVVEPHAVAFDDTDQDEALYVAGAETGPAGDLDLFVVSLEP